MRDSMKAKNQTTLANKYMFWIIAAICVIMMLISEAADIGGPFRFMANYTIVPMQRGISRAGTWMNDLTTNFETLETIKAENASLKEQVDNLTIENSQLQQDKRELERLQTLFKLDQDYSDYEKIGAHVVANNGNNWFNNFTIDKGTNDGVQVNSNVMAGTGLVGIVTEVGPNWAIVRSIIDDHSNISAMVLSTSDNCIVRGDLTLMNDGKIRFEQLKNNDNEIQVGEHIVTSAISPTFMQGILIGYVSEVKVDSNKLTRSGYITPAVDFSKLQEVLVIPKTKNDMLNNNSKKKK